MKKITTILAALLMGTMQTAYAAPHVGETDIFIIKPNFQICAGNNGSVLINWSHGFSGESSCLIYISYSDGTPPDSDEGDSAEECESAYSRWCALVK